MVSDRLLEIGSLYVFRGWERGPGPIRLWSEPTPHAPLYILIQEGDIVSPIRRCTTKSCAGPNIFMLTSKGMGWHVMNTSVNDVPLFEEL